MGFIIVLLVWAGMHAYVLSRLSSIQFLSRHVPSWLVFTLGAVLGASYILARTMEHFGLDGISRVMEYAGAQWVGVFFLLFAAFLVLDVMTGFGYLFPAHRSALRMGAVRIALGLAAVSFVQAWRTPVISEYEVTMPGLPTAADGTVMVVASDMHLGPMLGHRWATARSEQFNSMNPDLIVLAGDIFEGPAATHDGWLPVLQKIHARHGVYVVTGNHELYAGPAQIVALFQRAGFRVLHDESVEALPGLVVAGVDDVAFRRRRREDSLAAVDRALQKRPAGAVVFVSHTPVQAERAAQLGANLMVSGHTHNGQIWPFTYLVRMVFPLLTGRYDVNGMTAIVGRGTGTWGPRMRLWQRSEILKIRLRSRS